MRLSIIVPVLNEERCMTDALEALGPLRARGHEVIVTDGGSSDSTLALAGPLADRVIGGPPGRATQMNAGAGVANGEALVFLHVDTRLPEGADRLVAQALSTFAWGRFDVRIDSGRRLLGLVGAMMNLRSRLTGIATGDQCIFVKRAAFDAAGGFPPIRLMEDVAFSARLKRIGPPACVSAKVLTSGRRWERNGVLPTILLMWRLRLMYFLGADPDRLARAYSRDA